jgi:hypothetical protein
MASSFTKFLDHAQRRAIETEIEIEFLATGKTP